MIFLFVSVCFGSGCDRLYRVLDKRGAQEKELIGEVNSLEKNPRVEEIQRLLKNYGYNPGQIDGVLGAQTRDSLEAFQKDNGLTASRFVDEDTWAKLNIFEDQELITHQELNIRLIQKILKHQGFDPGGVDGNFGAQTKTATILFQKKAGLKADGKIGYKTLTELAKYLPVASSK